MTQHNTTAPATRQVTTKGFAILPHQVADTVPQAIKGAVRSVYPALHRRGWHSDQGCWASIKSLQDESGFGRPGVMAALRWLVSEGWVTKEQRPGFTSVYRVRIDDPQPPKNTNPSRKLRGGNPAENSRGGKQKTDGVPQQKTAHEQEPSNKNPRTRKEPPTHYVGFPPEGETHEPGDLGLVCQTPSPPPVASGTVVADPQPQHPAPADPKAPSPPKRKRMAKPQAFTPTQDDIPAALLPVEAPLRAFWEQKGGQVTKAAWDALLGNLERIWRDPDGGTEVVRQQIDNAIQSGWTSITHSNWRKYGPATPARAGGGTRKSATDQAADRVLAMFAARGIA